MGKNKNPNAAPSGRAGSGPKKAGLANAGAKKAGVKKQRILLLDNFDSFTYNLYQALSALGCEVDVVRNNALTLRQIKARGYSKIVISPGPGSPEIAADFGVCREVIPGLGREIPMLGVCLGHQGIASAFGGKIVQAPVPMHGKTSMVSHDGKGIFAGISNPLGVMRYHSLAAEEQSFPACLQVTARSDDGVIMGLRHREFPIFGVQFHPESIMTPEGEKILENFVNMKAENAGKNPAERNNNLKIKNKQMKKRHMKSNLKREGGL